MEFNRGIFLTLLTAVILFVVGAYSAFNFDMTSPQTSFEQNSLAKVYGCDESCNKILFMAVEGGVEGQPVGMRPADETAVIQFDNVTVELNCVYISPDGWSMWLSSDGLRIQINSNISDCQIVR